MISLRERVDGRIGVKLELVSDYSKNTVTANNDRLAAVTTGGKLLWRAPGFYLLLNAIMQQ